MIKEGSELKVKPLTKFTESQLAALRKLRVSAQQEIVGGSFIESLEIWRLGPSDQVIGLGFLFRGKVVGMTLFKRRPLSPAWLSENAASIHGLKIAEPWQGRGWGHLAFKLAVSYLKKQWPKCTTLMLAVDAENTAALAVYRAFGMTDSGPIFSGPNGREHHLEVTLKP